MEFTLIRSIVPRSKIKALETESGHVSYMGQILKQCGLPTFRKDKRPAYTVNDTPLKFYPPFIIYCNGRPVQSDLCTHIINTPPENELRVVQLLAQHNLTVKFED